MSTMDRNLERDSWYSGTKTVLKPLLVVNKEGFELEHQLLCSKMKIRADDCVTDAKAKGATDAEAIDFCSLQLAAYWACTTRIVCPVEMQVYVQSCHNNRSIGFSTPQCSRAMEALKKCASTANIPDWWMAPIVRPADRKEQDKMALRQMTSQKS